MQQGDFEYLRTFLKEQSGLMLSLDKGYLVESRLMPVARKRGLTGLDDLIGAMRAGSDEGLRVDVVEAMTTNESFCFRDIKPFESLREVVLPQIVEARKSSNATSLRIWSAACSSGQEPYTIAMILKEDPALLRGLPVEIVATDISMEIIAKAKAGRYTQFEAQRGLPVQFLVKYFKQEGENWQIQDTIRQMITYRHINLLHDLSPLGHFDIVFCRNVLIYFDSETKSNILNRASAIMPEDGILYLGGAESVLGISEAFEPLSGARGVYTINVSGRAQQTMPPAGLGVAAGLAKTA